jgi:hypothetical protein
MIHFLLGLSNITVMTMSMMKRVRPKEMLHLGTVTVTYRSSVEVVVKADGGVDVDVGLHYQRNIIQAWR